MEGVKLLPVIIPVQDVTRVAEVRRHAIAMSEQEGLSERAIGEVAIIATEISTNLLKHARSGEVHLNRLSVQGDPGIEIVSIDRGPGMANLHACTADGFSTSGTSGNGLGAISRLADYFDGYSQPGKGTVLVARKFARSSAPQSSLRKPLSWEFGAVRVPYPGEQACGDDWGVRHDGRSTSVIVADGLGHGVLAAEASGAARRIFTSTGVPKKPALSIEAVHDALKSTRGAAVAVLEFDDEAGRARYAGLGNISAVMLGGPKVQNMVSHNGTAGHEAHRVQQFEYALPVDATVILHSDGINTSWSLDAYPGIQRRHPAVIAAVLYRDATRGRDDVCVVVGRRTGVR